MITKLKIGVFIGRFQIFHRGHAEVLRIALAESDHVIVILGSAFKARDSKNPFTWEERKAMIEGCLSDSDKSRVTFVPVRDYYDARRWEASVASEINSRYHQAKVTLFGFKKDDSSAYLDWFQWQLREVPFHEGIDATALRAAYFEENAGEESVAAITPYIPDSVARFLRAWRKLPFWNQLCAEAKDMDEYLKQFQGPFPPTFFTADSVVMCQDKILVIRRRWSPGKGLLALPGGHVKHDQTAYQAALAELQEETNFPVLGAYLHGAFKEVKLFDYPHRSLRKRTVTVGHFFDFGDVAPFEVKEGDDGLEPTWMTKEEIKARESEFFEDHFHIIEYFAPLK